MPQQQILSPLMIQLGLELSGPKCPALQGKPSLLDQAEASPATPSSTPMTKSQASENNM